MNFHKRKSSSKYFSTLLGWTLFANFVSQDFLQCRFTNRLRITEAFHFFNQLVIKQSVTWLRNSLGLEEAVIVFNQLNYEDIFICERFSISTKHPRQKPKNIGYDCFRFHKAKSSGHHWWIIQFSRTWPVHSIFVYFNELTKELVDLVFVNFIEPLGISSPTGTSWNSTRFCTLNFHFVKQERRLS